MTPRQMGFADAPKPPVIDEERAEDCLAFGRRFPKQPAIEVVAFGIERYVEKYGVQPTVVMTSYADAQDLEGKTALRVFVPGSIAVGHFYLKRDEAA